MSSGPIMLGYDWTIRLKVNVPWFPHGCQLRSDIRENPRSSILLGAISTLDGTITRISDTELEITIPGQVSAAWVVDRVSMDLVRSDVDPEKHLGLTITVKTKVPVTRP